MSQPSKLIKVTKNDEKATIEIQRQLLIQVAKKRKPEVQLNLRKEIGSLVYQDKSNPNGDSESAILLLPASAAAGANSASKKSSKKSKKKTKNLSKKQKLLRKRLEESKNNMHNQEEADEADEQVAVKYSIVYFSWAVSDDEDDEQDQVKNVTLPLKSLRLGKK